MGEVTTMTWCPRSRSPSAHAQASVRNQGASQTILTGRNPSGQ